METILEHRQEKNYYLNIRKFANGTYEAVMKAVRPLSAEKMEAHIDGTSYSAACREKGATAMDGFPKRLASREEKSEGTKETNNARSVRRASQQVRWLVKEMRADRLLTLTYRENVEDREKVMKDFTRFLRLIRGGWGPYKGIPNWQYVAVLEKQDRGAFHIHCAIRGWQKLSFVRATWYKALGGTGAETGENTPGQIDVTSPRTSGNQPKKREWRQDKLAGYLTKYMQKTFDVSTAGKKRYWHSEDVKAPEKVQVWASGTEVVSGIVGAVAALQAVLPIRQSWDMWLSPDHCTFWMAGQLAGCA